MKRIDQQDAARLISCRLADDFPVKINDVRIFSDGRIEVAGVLDSRHAAQYLKSRGEKVKRREELMFRIIPEYAGVEGGFRLAIGRSGVSMKPLTLKVDGHRIDTDRIPEGITAEIEKAICKMPGLDTPRAPFAVFVEGAVLTAE